MVTKYIAVKSYHKNNQRQHNSHYNSNHTSLFPEQLLLCKDTQEVSVPLPFFRKRRRLGQMFLLIFDQRQCRFI